MELFNLTISDHRGELISSIIQGSDHTTLNLNTHTRIPQTNSLKPTLTDASFISTNYANQTTWETKTALASDHIPIIIKINTKTNFRLKSNNKTFTNYRKANWNEYKEEIEKAITNASTPDNVHEANKFLTNLICLADKHHIPKGRIKNLNQPLL